MILINLNTHFYPHVKLMGIRRDRYIREYTKGTTSNSKWHLILVHKTVLCLKQKQPITQTINFDDEAGSSVNFQPSNQYFNTFSLALIFINFPFRRHLERKPWNFIETCM